MKSFLVQSQSLWSRESVLPVTAGRSPYSCTVIFSALFGWTSKLPQRQINVFIRGNTLNIIQRGLEKSVVDISDWPHSRPTIERKLVRSIWHSNNNEDPDNQAHNEEDDAPVPFTGTISHEDISYTYEDGYLVREKNEDGETSYSYQNEYDHKGNLTGKYVSRKETRNKDGSMSEVEYVYAATANNIYLFKERERSKEPKDKPSYMDEPASFLLGKDARMPTGVSVLSPCIYWAEG